MTAEPTPGLLARLSPRRSFAGKILAALVGTLAIVLAIAFAAVRAETASQVESAAARAASVADITFRSIEGVQRAQLAEIASRVAQGPRAVAMLEAATESGLVEPLLENVDYELALAQLPPDQVLLVLTDPDGRTVAARAGGRMLEGGDPAGIVPLVNRMYDEGAPEVRAYRVVGGRLYNVHATFLELAGRPVGTFSLGLPMGDEQARQLGQVVGAEVCFVSEGRCLASSDPAGMLNDHLADGAPGPALSARFDESGGRWSLTSTPLDPADASVGLRVMAIPLDPVLLPFDRISRTLALAGALALALSVVLGAALARGLARPVRALVAATGKVARGDYDADVPVTSADELGALARSFNDMIHGLRLKERYRGVLNKVVSPEVAEELMQGGVELGGENREVTVVFADIRGFTPLTEGMEPQDVIRLLNDCMAVLSAAVDAEGGVVDKYVGDQIMAVFGAPVRTPDHASRALRAAVRMKDGMAAVNAARAARGQAAIHIGVGVNTGVAVAGNMGSPERLNYTVLGEGVNLASRLCGAADAEQILATPWTVAAAGDIRATPLGERALKGFSAGTEVLAVEGVVAGSARGLARGAVATAALLLALSVGSAAPLGAQAAESGLPTLEDLGLWWATADGRWQVGFSGRLDLEAYHAGPDAVGLMPAADAFAAPRGRVFLDAFAGERVYGSLELRVDRGETPAPGDLDARLEQLFVRVRPTAASAELQLGRFASPFGAYAGRHHTPADVFVRPPLAYDGRTVLQTTAVPPNANGLLTWKDRTAEFRPTGSPIVWNVPYQWGVMALVRAGPLDGRVAWMNGVPSSAPPSWGWDADRFEHGALVLGATWAATPELKVGGSWTRGSFLEPLVRGSLPAGAALHDFDQELWGAEATFSRGPVVVRAEGFRDSWEIPNVAEPATDLSWYAELQSDLIAGVWLAGRIGATHFGEIAGAAGGGPWDYDVVRGQVAAGYRIVRNAEFKLEWMRNDSEGPLDPRDDLWSAQLWWAY